MVPEMLLCTRYGVGIKDQAWFDHRVQVIGNITAPSLLSQTNRNFTWVIFVDPDMPAVARAQLEHIIAPFGSKAVLYTETPLKNVSVAAVARKLGLVSPEGIMLTGRIDDDDAFAIETMQQVYDICAERLAAPEPLRAMAVTFDYGIEWVMYDIYDVDMKNNRGRDVVRKAEVRPFHSIFMGDSVFMLSRAETGVTCFATGHGKIRDYMTENGYEVRVVSPDRPMWLYSRHKQVSTNLVHGIVTPLDLTIEDLGRMFGLDVAGVKAYIATADQYAYLLEKRTEHRRNVAIKALRDFDRAQAGAPLTPEQAEERRRMAAEVEKLSSSLLGSVEELKAATAAATA